MVFKENTIGPMKDSTGLLGTVNAYVDGQALIDEVLSVVQTAVQSLDDLGLSVVDGKLCTTYNN